MNFSLILERLQERLSSLGLELLDFVPNIVTALFVMLVGWLAAWLTKVLIARTGDSLAARLSSLRFMGHGLDRGGDLARVMAAVAYWVLLLVFAAVAVEQLDSVIITDLFSELTRFLPDVVLAAAILFLGIALGRGARSGIATAAATAGIASAATLGRLVQIGIVTAAALVASDQIGVESQLLIIVFAITVGTSLGGVALAFGIGSGTMVSNIIASHGVRKAYRAGESIRIGSTQGRILEIGATEVTIDTEEGTVHVPADRFAKEISVTLRNQ